jgi:Amt family ammonium transporter
MPESTATICLLAILLTPLAVAGIALVNTGMGRAHSAAHAILASICVLGVAAGVYLLCGFSLQGVIGGPAHSFTLGGKAWNWLASRSLVVGSANLAAPPTSLVILLQVFSVGLAALIPLGAGLDRWKLSASCLSVVLLAGIVYPLFAHWSWAGGWLAQLSLNAGLGRGFVDAGGSGAIHAVGGLTALAVACILGPRTGKYSEEGIPAAIPGHSTVCVLLGCFLSLLGWIGLNSAGAILFYGVATQGIPLIAVNTVLSAGAAVLIAALLTRYRFGRPDASLSANGWVAGLVAGSAACAFIEPIYALLIGFAAGALAVYSVELFEARFAVDDPAGSISVHAIGGLWGLVAVGIFARFPAPLLNVSGGDTLTAQGSSGQWLAQLVGVATLLGLVLPLSYVLNLAANRVFPYRIVLEGERQGLDLYELGGGAYPEFATHSEDFTQLRKRSS